MLNTNNTTLKPIIEPDSVACTMDTIGWKVLFFLIFCIILYSIYKYYQIYRNNRYRRVAITNIDELSNTENISVNDLIVRVMFLIKETALQTYDRKKVASLEGVNWLQFLDKKVKNVNFTRDQEIILNAVYRDRYDTTNKFNRDAFVKNASKWIKDHA